MTQSLGAENSEKSAPAVGTKPIGIVSLDSSYSSAAHGVGLKWKEKPMAEYIVRETGYPGTLKQEIVGELVRCRDCRNNDHEFCYVHEFRTSDLGYCHFAERKDDAEAD